MKQYLTAAALALALTATTSAVAAEQNLLSVHVLNQQTGKPAANVDVTLEQKQGNGWTLLNKGTTDRDGRIKQFWPAQPAATGDYRVVFMVGHYFSEQKQESFFPEIPVEFHISNTHEHYHVPLLLSQYGYSTYRGS